MDAIQTSRAHLFYSGSHSDRPPVLIGASSDTGRRQAIEAVEAAGWRIGDAVALEEAQDRIGLQVSTSAIWIEVDRDCGSALDSLLAGISKDVSDGRYAAVVSTTAELLDPVSALLDGSDVEIIVDASEEDRIAALPIAIARAQSGRAALSDVASDQSAARLRQLSDEVSRIAATLARLSSTPPVHARPQERSTEQEEPPEVSADTVRSVISARRLRSRYFPEHLFADPAWDMLLDLFQAEIAQLRVPVSSLCIAAAVPATTALRWLKTMVQEGLFIRRADPLDRRRVFVELAPRASEALRRYFAEVGKVATM